VAKEKVIIKKLSEKSRDTASLFRKKKAEPEKKKSQSNVQERKRAHQHKGKNLKRSNFKGLKCLFPCYCYCALKDILYIRVFKKILIKDKDSRYKLIACTSCREVKK
jgi:hypothetical protein